jgi:hypothetical protein
MFNIEQLEKIIKLAKKEEHKYTMLMLEEKDQEMKEYYRSKKQEMNTLFYDTLEIIQSL